MPGRIVGYMQTALALLCVAAVSVPLGLAVLHLLVVLVRVGGW